MVGLPVEGEETSRQIRADALLQWYSLEMQVTDKVRQLHAHCLSNTRAGRWHRGLLPGCSSVHNIATFTELEIPPTPDRRLLTYGWWMCQVPPVFVFHGADDAVVPVENSRLFVQALKQHAVRSLSPVSGLWRMRAFVDSMHPSCHSTKRQIRSYVGECTLLLFAVQQILICRMHSLVWVTINS